MPPCNAWKRAVDGEELQELRENEALHGMDQESRPWPATLGREATSEQLAVDSLYESRTQSSLPTAALLRSGWPLMLLWHALES